MQYAILGKLLATIFFFVAAPLAGIPDCFLEIRNGDGAIVSTVGMGVPFQIVVVARDCTEQPQVQFDESPFALLRRVSVQTRTVNGHSTVSYIYSARIDAKGLYDIGPASVVIGGILYETNHCSVEVGAHEKVIGSRFMIEVTLDDAEIYVGQETKMRIRIYSAVAGSEIESLHIAPVKDLVVGEFVQVKSDSEYQDGIKYWYKEFAAPLCAQTAGSFLIPSCSADIRDEQARRGGFFFFSAIAPTKQIHSNTTVLSVRDMPSINKFSSLIGDYKDVIASVDPAIITVGHAVKYRLTIYGSGNNTHARAPLLSGIPDSCKYYDSCVKQLEHEEGVVFEYIIQPRYAGTWEIPSQEVVYFDPREGEFYSLFSEPVAITANPSAEAPIVADNNSALSQGKQDLREENNTVQQYHPDLSAADPVENEEYRIPWFWCWVCLVCLWIVLISNVCGSYIFNICSKNKYHYKRYWALQRARRALYALEQGKSSTSVHHIFVTFFADWFMVEPSTITEMFIKEHIKTVGLLSEEGLEAWRRFWHIIVQAQYGHVKTKNIDRTVYAEARLWINAFSKFSKFGIR